MNLIILDLVFRGGVAGGAVLINVWFCDFFGVLEVGVEGYSFTRSLFFSWFVFFRRCIFLWVFVIRLKSFCFFWRKISWGFVCFWR